MGLTRDEKYMREALDEAYLARDKDQLPIGAVLVIDDKLIGREHNTQRERKNWTAHAENNLIKIFGSEIKSAYKKGKQIEIYSSLEPCLQCFGSIVHNRFSRVIYACPDPAAGATSIEIPTKWYERHWPDIVSDIFRQEAFDLCVEYMQKDEESWKNVLPYYLQMAENWKAH